MIVPRHCELDHSRAQLAALLFVSPPLGNVQRNAREPLIALPHPTFPGAHAPRRKQVAAGLSIGSKIGTRIAGILAWYCDSRTKP
jgi:hypothetical protein